MFPGYVYSLTVLLSTSLWVFGCDQLRQSSVRMLGVAMLFPAFFAAILSPDRGHFWELVIGRDESAASMTFSVFGGLIVILQLAMISGLNYATGWAVEQADRKKAPEGSGDLLGGFLRAAGEEIGWRSFLLPQLLSRYGRFYGVLISGVVWGSFHLPLMLVLMRKPHVTHPWRSILCQFMYCIIQSFPMAWLAVKTGFSFWAPTMMHFVWNRINPVVFGSIYTQKQGKMMGPLWLVNGEGLAGCLAILPFAALFGWRLVA